MVILQSGLLCNLVCCASVQKAYSESGILAKNLLMTMLEKLLVSLLTEMRFWVEIAVMFLAFAVFHMIVLERK